MLTSASANLFTRSVKTSIITSTQNQNKPDVQPFTVLFKFADYYLPILILVSGLISQVLKIFTSKRVLKGTFVNII